MKFPLGFKVDLMRFLRGFVRPKLNVLAVGSNNCAPPFVVLGDAKKSGGVACFCASLVFGVFGRADQPQVANSVISADPVDVVYQKNGPLAMHVKPSKPMRPVHFGVDFDLNVTLSIFCSRYRTHTRKSGASNFPPENTLGRVVRQQVVKLLLREDMIVYRHFGLLFGNRIIHKTGAY